MVTVCRLNASDYANQQADAATLYQPLKNSIQASPLPQPLVYSPGSQRPE